MIEFSYCLDAAGNLIKLDLNDKGSGGSLPTDETRTGDLVDLSDIP